MKSIRIFALYLKNKKKDFLKKSHIYKQRIKIHNIKKMRTINIHMISISNWRRNSHRVSGMFNCEGGTEV